MNKSSLTVTILCCCQNKYGTDGFLFGVCIKHSTIHRFKGLWIACHVYQGATTTLQIWSYLMKKCLYFQIEDNIVSTTWCSQSGPGLSMVEWYGSVHNVTSFSMFKHYLQWMHANHIRQTNLEKLNIGNLV